MVQLLYNLLLTAAAPLALPYWALRSLAKGHSPASLLEGLGRLAVPTNSTERPAVWFHAVSVGEVQSSLPLLRELRRKLGESCLLYVSTGTATGRELAEGRLEGVADGIFRAPVDLPWCVASVLARLRPRVLVVAETELWPNYFFQARRHGIRTIIVNGRISDRAAPRYLRFAFLFRPALAGIDRILVQSRRDRRRFLAAGASPAATAVGGNLKYDFDARATARSLPADIGDFLDACDPSLLVVAGSTREGEESMLLGPLLEAAAEIPDCLIVVAPRHPHRFAEAASALAASGLPVQRRSELGRQPSPPLPAWLLLDSLGELAALYERADLVVMGGSFNGWGGHNVLEPVSFGKAVAVGPHMQNFQQITDDLLAAGGLVQVDGPQGLRRSLRALASSPEQRDRVGRAGQALADSMRGASERAAADIVSLVRQALPVRPPSALQRLALGIPSAAWGFAARCRRQAYEEGLVAKNRLPMPVISVGNLAAGGTGKTPTVAWLVESLANRGHASAVLTRGYKRSDSRTRALRVTAAVDPLVAGDEPAMLAKRFAGSAPGTLLGVGKDRYAAGLLARKAAAVDFALLDDGFQHLSLDRALNIVLLDGAMPFGNGRLLPLGRLREPITSLRYADVVLITRCRPGTDYSLVSRAVRAENPRAVVFHSRMVSRSLVELHTGREHPLDLLAGQRVGAFCGIGNPAQFFAELRRLGCDLVYRRPFRDHHRYSQHEVDGLTRGALARGAEALVTTAKDVMNLASLGRLALPAYLLEMDIEVDRADKLLDMVLAARRY